MSADGPQMLIHFARHQDEIIGELGNGRNVQNHHAFGFLLPAQLGDLQRQFPRQGFRAFLSGRRLPPS